MDDNANKKSGHWAPWVSAIIIILILCGTFLLYKIITIPEKTMRFLKQEFATEVNITNISYHFLEKVRKESKLVVMTAEVSVNIERSSKKIKKILWVHLNLGTTVVEIKIPGNKVQYILPVDHMSADDFKFDSETRELTVLIPSPIIDKEIVEVQNDPAKITVRKQIGWGRLQEYSGKYLEKRIKADLRNEVIKAARSELLVEKARENAITTVTNLIKNLLKKHASDVKIIVKFKNAQWDDFKDSAGG